MQSFFPGSKAFLWQFCHLIVAGNLSFEVGRDGFPFYKEERKAGSDKVCSQVAGGTGAQPTLSGRRGYICDIFGPGWEPPQSPVDPRLAVWGMGQGVGGDGVGSWGLGVAAIKS